MEFYLQISLKMSNSKRICRCKNRIVYIVFAVLRLFRFNLASVMCVCKKLLFYFKHTTLRYVHNVPILGNFLWILNWYWRNITNSSAFGFSFCFSPEKGYVYGEHRTNERMVNIQNIRMRGLYIQNYQHNSKFTTIHHRRQPAIFSI